MANFQVLNLVRFRVRFQISILKKWRNLVGAGNSTVLMCLFQNYFLDDRLIKLVRENSAIYDVSHPHYRRTPVRMAIWDNIARELGAPCKSIEALQCILFSGVRCSSVLCSFPSLYKKRVVSFLVHSSFVGLSVCVVACGTAVVCVVKRRRNDH